MTLPSMPTGIVGREYVRVAGGYGAPSSGTSPAGGLDIDAAGHLATDGDMALGGQLDVQSGSLGNSTGNLSLDALSATADSTITFKNSDATYETQVTVEGDLLVQGNLELGSAGVNRSWSAWLRATDGLGNGGNPPTGPTAWNLWSGIPTNTLDYITISAFVDAVFQVILPPDYDGSALELELYWTANSGTSGSILWQTTSVCYQDGSDATSAWGGVTSMTETFQGQLIQHVAALTTTPANASNGNIMYFLIRRNGSHVNDTFDGTARLQGIRVSYA